MRSWNRFVVLFGVVALSTPALALLESGATTAAEGNTQRRRFESGRQMVFFPGGHLFPLHIADPHRPGSGLLFERQTSTEIEGASDERFFLKVGGRFGFFRWLPMKPEGRSWQLSLEAGLDAQFDNGHGLDNTGWDGNYGLSLTTTRGGGKRAYLIGILHTSAHIGDEWIERTGRERLNYTREEARAAVSCQLAPSWRTYFEAAYGYTLRTDENIMAPLRTQIGLELEKPETLWSGLAGWYVATDLSSWEERDWRLDLSLQGGLMIESAGRTWRFGLQYYDGRVPLGEFFQETEAGFTIGLWVDL